MDELKIKAFENLIIENCNKTPIPNKVKYYVLKDIAQKCFDASELDVLLALRSIPTNESESEVVENGN